MIEYDVVGPRGDEWTVAVQTDIQRFLCPGIGTPPSQRVFCEEEYLRWIDETIAWKDGDTQATCGVDHVILRSY